jgi:hypothetical protein
MRRFLVLALAAGLLTLWLAPAALAQRDPFKPVTGPGSSSSSEPAPEDQSGPLTNPELEPQTQPENDSDNLATTGSDPAPFVVIAYGLIVAGAAGVFLARAWSTDR